MSTSSDRAATAGSPRVGIAGCDELPEILRVQRAAFRRAARDLDIPEDRLPPLLETLDTLRRLHDAGNRFFAARVGRTVAGTVRARRREDGVVEVGRLAVDDGCERLGVATALMCALEDSFPDASRFELFTGAEAVAPLALYDRLGYRQFAREGHEGATFLWLAKDR